jgi:hypothetical protein
MNPARARSAQRGALDVRLASITSAEGFLLRKAGMIDSTKQIRDVRPATALNTAGVIQPEDVSGSCKSPS